MNASQSLKASISARGAPFFAWVHLYDPHSPYEPPEPFRSRYAGADSPIVVATLNAIQLSAMPLDPLIEVTSDWTILWTAFRVKLLRNPDDTTTITLSAPPEAYTSSQWTARTDEFFATLERELLRLELSKGREGKGSTPPAP